MILVQKSGEKVKGFYTSSSRATKGGGAMHRSSKDGHIRSFPVTLFLPIESVTGFNGHTMSVV